MNIEIKSRSIWVLGHWKATDHFRAHIYPVKKNAISHFTEGVNKNVILHL